MAANQHPQGETTRNLFAKLLLPLVVGVLTVLLTHAPALNLGVVERLELASLDFRFQIRGVRPLAVDSSHVVIVEISRESFESLPDKWPWPRSYYARLVRNLARAGARAVCIDILLTGNDMYSPANDEELRKAIRETGIVVLAGKLEVQKKDYLLRSAAENYSNLFYNTDSSLGFVNIRSDADDVVRRYFPFVKVEGVDSVQNLPTLGFAVLNKYYRLPSNTAPLETDDGFTYAGTTIPMFDPYSLLINYYGANESFRHVKFVDVLDDGTFSTVEEKQTGEEINNFSDPEFGYLYDGTFKDKIVLVGSTLPEDQDLYSIPIAEGKQAGDNKMYGVELHANLIESVLRNDFLQRQSLGSEILIVLILSFVTFLVTSYIKGSKTRYHALVEINGFLFAVAEIFVIGFLSLRLFIDYGYIVSIVSPVVAVVGGYVASTTYHFVSERRQRLLIKMMFSTYVSPSVVDELISHPEKLRLGGERKELSVLFSDLEGFTTLAETTPPDELVGLLNEYLTAMTQVIMKNNGTLDKFEGDLIMAFWGAPIPQNDHVFRTCTAALQMQSALATIRREWPLKNKPELFARIGINTGEMVVGNMGSTEKFNYTVIGDSVNIASRLEGANKIYKTGIILSESSYNQVRVAFRFRELDLLAVKGRTEPIRIYELLSTVRDPLSSTEEQFLLCYLEALQAYKERRWRDARQRFADALRLKPSDCPSQIYVERLGYLMSNPPPADWDGVFVTLRKQVSTEESSETPLARRINPGM